MASEETEFQFELNETLYFDDGYEVEELISVSLEPEVTIQSYDTYVSIRGEIELHGEYVREAKDTSEEPNLDFDSFQTKRFIEKVEIRNDKTAEFTHRFPVDISVPAYRINSVDDIRVEMTDFDYELPANDTLKLNAVATIHGMKTEIDLLEEKQTRESEDLEIENKNHDESIEFEIKRSEMDKEEEETTVTVEQTNRIEEMKVEEEEATAQIPDVESAIESPAEETETRTVEQVEENEEESKSEIEIAESAYKEEEESVKDVSYLTDMFRDEEEERYSKMRICIVQEDDTIEKIAERFQVSALQLIKNNKLEDDYEVSEGQLLYIPKK